MKRHDARRHTISHSDRACCICGLWRCTVDSGQNRQVATCPGPTLICGSVRWPVNCRGTVLVFSIAAMASLVETPRREPATGQYSCAACNGAGVLDKERYHRLTETPGPLFISPSQRSPAEKAATPSYIFSVTGKNRRREQERKRRQDAEKVEGRRKRSKKPEAVVADSDDSNGDDED